LGHVYSATKDGVFVIGKSGTRMFVLRDSVLKMDEFLELRRGLKSEGKLVDPTIKGRATVKQRMAVTETLDDIIARGEVEDFDIDVDIKRKLNPKRINDGITNDFNPSAISMSTTGGGKRKYSLESLEQDHAAFEARLSSAETAKKKKPKVEPKKPTVPPLFEDKKPKKKLSPFAKFKKQQQKKKNGGKK
jgi:hypothetical protein